MAKAICRDMYYTVADVAGLLGVNERLVRLGIKEQATGWTFPVVISGIRIMIPRHSFDVWYRERFGTEVQNETKARG